jgi:hypothetical protein
MKMRFHGACGVVTGSMTELMDEKLGVHFLVDCGAQQGVDTPLETRGNFDFEPKDIQFVLHDACARGSLRSSTGACAARFCWSRVLH